MKIALAFLFISSAAYAQDAYSELTAGGRISIPGGTATNQDNTSWGDVLKTGYGFEAEYSYLCKLSDNLYLGPVAEFSIDYFQGKSDTINGLTVTPDTLQVAGLSGGVRLRENFGKLFFDQTIAGGTSVYKKDDAKFSAGAVSVKAEAIKGTWAALFEAGGRAGISLDNHVDVGVGVGFQLNGAPKAGAAFASGFNFKDQQNLIVALDINFNF